MTKEIYPPRRMVLTAEDIRALVAEMKSQGITHICRYDVPPEDMKILMAFVKTVFTNVTETRRVVRKTVIKILVYSAFAGFLLWLGDRYSIFKEIAKGFLRSGP